MGYEYYGEGEITIYPPIPTAPRRTSSLPPLLCNQLDGGGVGISSGGGAPLIVQLAGRSSRGRANTTTAP